MTAVTRASSVAPTRSAAYRPGLPTLRLLRLELRHNAMAWLLPVVFGLFWLVTYRKTMAMPPLWNLRAASLQTGAVADFAVPVTGAAAWMASREARRRVTDQVTITARSRWTRLLITWAATTIWAMVAYLGCLAVVYGVTAHQATWGGPLWWPAAVAAASVLLFCALGFVIGAILPSRFTPPLVAIATFFVLALSTEPITGGHSPFQVSPIVTGPWDMGAQAGVATFYPFQPDLSIVQVMFLAGLTVALLGVLALPARTIGRAVRAVAAGCTVAGLLATGTAVGLTGTGTMDAAGMIDIPALHDAASDRPLRFTPMCSHTAIPVCLNPAYATYLSATASALAPLLGQLAGPAGRAGPHRSGAGCLPAGHRQRRHLPAAGDGGQRNAAGVSPDPSRPARDTSHDDRAAGKPGGRDVRAGSRGRRDRRRARRVPGAERGRHRADDGGRPAQARRVPAAVRTAGSR